MEFEVLNEILTGTVAQLFTGSQNHATMNKTSSQMGQVPEIPRKSSFSEMSPDLDPVTTPGQGQSVNDSPLSAWLMVEAKVKYQSACNRLGLDAGKIQGKHLSSFTVEDLNREKRKVKNELKVYDQSFQQRFKKLPTRAEKEPMRNLYMYYKRLKQSITKKQARGGDSDSGMRQAAAAHHGTSGSELGSAPGSRAGSHVSGRSQASGQSGVSLASGLTANTSGSKEGGGPSQPQQTVAGKQRFPSASSQEDFKREDTGGSRLTADNLATLGTQEKSELEELKRKFAIHTVNDAQKTLASIKNERKELRTKLDQFQKNFETVHNRKIRYTKDIVAVQSEFKKYKDLKVDVAKIEKLIKLLPKH